MKNVILIGLPGSGKSTIASHLAKALGFSLVSFSEEVTKISQSDSELAEKIRKHCQPEWQTLSNELAIGALRSLRLEKKAPWVLEGFPETKYQAKEISSLAQDALVYWLDVPPKLSVRRLLERGQKIDTIHQRIEQEDSIDRLAGVINLFDKKIRQLNGRLSPQTLVDQIINPSRFEVYLLPESYWSSENKYSTKIVLAIDGWRFQIAEDWCSLINPQGIEISYPECPMPDIRYPVTSSTEEGNFVSWDNSINPQELSFQEEIFLSWWDKCKTEVQKYFVQHQEHCCVQNSFF